MTGAAKYTVDIRHDGQLEGVILRSPIAHGRITELDLAPALAMPGVSAAVSLLGDDRMVRFVGDPIAAVAAKDRKTALAAIAAIRMTSEPLPSVIGLDAARKPDAPVVFEKASRKKAGNVSEGARRAGTVERQYPRTVRGVLAEGEEGAELGRRRARRDKIRCWSRARSAPARNRMPASSRMPPLRASTATGSPCTPRRSRCFTSWS